MMAALLRQGARKIGGSLLQRTQAAVRSSAVAEERRRLLRPGSGQISCSLLETSTTVAAGQRQLVPRRMLSTEKRASEEIMRDIQRKQHELPDAIEEGKRSIQAATDWRKEQKLFDAIAKARRSITFPINWSDEDLQECIRRAKPLLNCLLKQEEAEKKKREEAKKKREQ